MGGRSDYEERKKRRIERYQVLSEKAKEESEARYNSTANRILMATPGQPIIVGHHSEKKARKLHEQANNDIKKSIEFSEKSKYYRTKAKNVENSNAIYNDDPDAIPKLKDKIERLENQKESIKAREHTTWELTNIGAKIRETKLRIKRLEEQEQYIFLDIEFKGGKAIHNKEINRIQLLFDSKPEDNIRSQLKHNGFHWSRQEGAWQREFNKRTIYVTNALIKDILNKGNENEESEEFE
ncbi:MAG: DUF3560 domain-containing protein [Clostridia bacterium]|nr:DUF3560 domain-containing protein [Clostridia bacterium]